MINKLPTIDIKGKKYVQVKDRVAYFNETFSNGAIHTKIISYEGKRVVVMAKIVPDVTKPERYFTGLSQADETQGMVNSTAALENAETSAVGRALGMMGIGVIESIASADEVNKAISGQSSASKTSGYSMKCPVHGEEVFEATSKAGNSYFLCRKPLNGKPTHFLKDDRQDEVPGLDSNFINDQKEGKQDDLPY